MLHVSLKICLFIFIAFCVLIPTVWLYETFTKGFSWNETAVYAKSFVIFVALGFLSHWAINKYFN